MPRFYLHLHNSVGLVRDEEGLELADIEVARRHAVKTIRSILSDEVRHGRLDLRGVIEIAGEDQQVLGVVRFEEAVDLRREPTVR